MASKQGCFLSFWDWNGMWHSEINIQRPRSLLNEWIDNFFDGVTFCIVFYGTIYIVKLNEGIPRTWPNSSEIVNWVRFLSGCLVRSRWKSNRLPQPITRLQTNLYVKNASSSLLRSLHNVYIENLIRFLYRPKNKICQNHMVNKRRLDCNVILNYTQMCGEQIDIPLVRASTVFNCKLIHLPNERPTPVLCQWCVIVC